MIVDRLSIAGGACAVFALTVAVLGGSAEGRSAGVARGSYECWSSNRANLTLNFTVTGPGTYRASDGSKSTFAFNPGTKSIVFAGYLKDAMPKGFTTFYHEPKGHPTVSFQARGGEAAFCEKV